jgi:hypothetical protein
LRPLGPVGLVERERSLPDPVVELAGADVGGRREERRDYGDYDDHGAERLLHADVQYSPPRGILPRVLMTDFDLRSQI